MNEELNKKLAEWAFPNADNIDVVTGGRITITHDDIKYPDYPWSIEYFTKSSDACFKWFVPRLWICNITLEEGIFWNVKVSIPDYHGINKHGNGQALDEKLALALCLAIERLIDGGKQNGKVTK